MSTPDDEALALGLARVFVAAWRRLTAEAEARAEARSPEPKGLGPAEFHAAVRAHERTHAKAQLTVREAAAALGLKEPTIRQWIARRKLGHVRLGGAIRIPRAEVDRLIEAGTTPARRDRK